VLQAFWESTYVDIDSKINLKAFIPKDIFNLMNVFGNKNKTISKSFSISDLIIQYKKNENFDSIR
jgi:hypothetical protein